MMDRYTEHHTSVIKHEGTALKYYYYYKVKTFGEDAVWRSSLAQGLTLLWSFPEEKNRERLANKLTEHSTLTYKEAWLLTQTGYITTQ